MLHGTREKPKRLVSDVVRSALVLSLAALYAAVSATLSAAAPEALKRGLLGDIARSWATAEAGDLLVVLLDPDPPSIGATTSIESGTQDVIVSIQVTFRMG